MKKPKKERLDQLVFARGLASDVVKAQALILAGEVLIDGKPGAKAGDLVSIDSEVSLAHSGPQYVSRGGIKLAGALDHFGLNPSGLVCLDVGASTGGFADCLLQRGAAHVYCVDVGKGQLDPKIRNDPRVTWRESFHARKLDPALFEKPIDLAVVDVSFISLAKVFPFVLPCVRPGGRVLSLIKPQFEAAKKDIPKGVIKDEKKRREILKAMQMYATETAGLSGVALIDSTLAGPKGNLEAFLCGRLKGTVPR